MKEFWVRLVRWLSDNILIILLAFAFLFIMWEAKRMYDQTFVVTKQFEDYLILQGEAGEAFKNGNDGYDAERLNKLFQDK